MSAPYTVEWFDRCGPVGYQQFDTFEEAAAVYRAKNTTGSLVAASIHGDGAEFDGEHWDDGLTDEEREAL